jgi:hypothetical protein
VKHFDLPTEMMGMLGVVLSIVIGKVTENAVCLVVADVAVGMDDLLRDMICEKFNQTRWAGGKSLLIKTALKLDKECGRRCMFEGNYTLGERERKAPTEGPQPLIFSFRRIEANGLAKQGSVIWRRRDADTYCATGLGLRWGLPRLSMHVLPS